MLKKSLLCDEGNETRIELMNRTEHLKTSFEPGGGTPTATRLFADLIYFFPGPVLEKQHLRQVPLGTLDYDKFKLYFVCL